MIYGIFYDGKSSARQSCGLRVNTEGKICFDGIDIDPCSFDSLNIPSRIGNTARLIRLPDNASFETTNNDAVDKLIKKYKTTSTLFNPHEWESKLVYIALSVVLTAGLLVAVVKLGIPFASKKIADELPAYVSISLADKALSELDKSHFSESTLGMERQTELRKLFKLYLPKDSDFTFTLYFRTGNNFGANAIALPNGNIILTDELIALANNDEEILAVLLHEIGHIVHRHSLRSVVEAAGLYAIYSWMTGDIEISSTLILSLPAILMQAKFSRGHEWEADTFSLDQMLENNIDPIHFANMMTKLDKSNRLNTINANDDTNKTTKIDKNTEKDIDGETTSAHNIFVYLSSHPASQDRIARFEKASEIKNSQ